MEKVKLTQEQADAFESEVLTSDVKSVARCHMRGWEYRCNRCLNELSLEQIMRAKYVGYEICPEYKVGEWKVVKYSNEIGQVVEHFKEKQRVELDCNYFTYKEVDLRSATLEEIAEEKERRWWAEHNRDVWELRFDDVLIHEEKQELIRVVDVQFTGAVIVFINNGYRESLNISYIKQLYSVVCFAEDRKDVKE